MNSLFVISILSWVGMWFAFHLGHPVGYVISLIGLAAAVAIALEAPSPETETAAIEPTVVATHKRQGRSTTLEHQTDAVVWAGERRRTVEAPYSSEIRDAA